MWDGTKCPRTLLKVIVEPDVTEGPSSFSKKKENLIANVFVYDNHVEFARQLKVRNKFLKEIIAVVPKSSVFTTIIIVLTQNSSVLHFSMAWEQSLGVCSTTRC